MKDRHMQILIVGAGIVGLTVARKLVETGFDHIGIIEKEPDVGYHASGRNSGVLHAGIYYAPDSVKAGSCLKGNLKMQQYCREKGLPIENTGKVIVARRASELPVLESLFERARANGAKVDWIDEKTLESIEPNAKTVKQAIYSHYTSVVDPKKVLQALRADLEKSGRVRFFFGHCFQGLKGSAAILTHREKIGFQYLINAAGAHSDKIAKAFGLGNHFRLIPFKGIYHKLVNHRAHLVKGSIYPVPDIRNPFLGIHFTRNVYGDVYLGPTAIPAFGRENYGLFQGIDHEGPRILFNDARLFYHNQKFRNVALTEPRKYLFSWFFRDATQLVKHLEPSDVEPSPKAGIRAQLVDWRTKELVQDFCLLKNSVSLHILNPVSPAFTSSMDLAEKIVGEFKTMIGGDDK
jgi:L-2-hydroxyglutarate oxidase LhgO